MAVTPCDISDGTMAISWCTCSGAHWHIDIWPDAFIHEPMRHSPPTLRWYNINDRPLPSPTHTNNLCVGVYMCTCVCTARESVLTFSTPPSHTYALIRPGTWHELFSFIYMQMFFLIWCPPHPDTYKKSYTKGTRLFFKIIGTVTTLSRRSTCFCWGGSSIWVLPPVPDDYPLLQHTISHQ